MCSFVDVYDANVASTYIFGLLQDDISLHVFIYAAPFAGAGVIVILCNSDVPSPSLCGSLCVSDLRVAPLATCYTGTHSIAAVIPHGIGCPSKQTEMYKYFHAETGFFT